MARWHRPKTGPVWITGPAIAVIAAIVLTAPLASAITYYQQNPPWQNALELNPINHGTGTYTNAVSGGPPSAGSGFWAPTISSKTFNLATAHFEIEGVYYDNVPASEWGGFASPASSSNSNPGGLDMAITCVPGGSGGSGLVWAFNNVSVNVYSSATHSWAYATPLLVSNGGVGISGACPKSYVNPISGNWPGISGLGGSCGPTLGNCTIQLFYQVTFLVSSVNDVDASACEWFATPPISCSSAGFVGNFQLQYVVT